MAAKDLSDIFSAVGLGTSAAGAFVGAGGAYAKTAADNTAYSIQATVADNNAAIETARASDAITRGQKAVVNSQLKTAQLKGQQIATMAANGIDLASGSANSILSSTDLMGENDASIIALNAAKETWGYRVAEANDRSNASLYRSRASSVSPGLAATGSLLTSAGAVASKWYSTRNPFADL